MIKSLDTLLAELKELKEKSTPVVAWYAHPGQVRGPFNRWFEITDVLPEHEKDVGKKADDAAYAAAAMNEVPRLVKIIEILHTVVKYYAENPHWQTTGSSSTDWPREILNEVNALVKYELMHSEINY